MRQPDQKKSRGKVRNHIISLGVTYIGLLHIYKRGHPAASLLYCSVLYNTKPRLPPYVQQGLDKFQKKCSPPHRYKESPAIICIFGCVWTESYLPGGAQWRVWKKDSKDRKILALDTGHKSMICGDTSIYHLMMNIRKRMKQGAAFGKGGVISLASFTPPAFILE